MPDFGVKATALSNADISGAKYIQPGVEDKSGAIGIAELNLAAGTVGTQAIEAYKGKNIADLEKGINPLIEEVKTRSTSATIFGSNIPEEQISPVLKEFNITTNKYKSAVEQGVMSKEEFELRLKAKLRSSVNNNPGLFNELTTHANNLLELSGVKDILNADEEAAKASAKANDELQKYYMGIAKDKNVTIPFNRSGSINMPELVKKVQTVQVEDMTVDNFKRADSFTEEDVKTYGHTMVLGLLNQVNDLAIKTLNDPTIPYEKSKLNISMMMDSVEQQLFSDPRIARIADKPSVQTMLKFAQDQIASRKSAFNSYASKEDASAYLKNATEMARNNNYLAVSRTVNPVALDSLSKLMAITNIANMISKYPEKQIEIVNSASTLIQGLSTHSTDMLEGQPGEKPLAVEVINGLAKDAGQENADKSVLALSNTIQSININIKNLDLPQTYAFFEPYVKALGSGANKVGIDKLDTTAKTQALSNVSDYTVITLKDMQNTVNRYIGQGVKVSADVMADGRIMFSSDNPVITNELNKKYGLRINDSISAYANLDGSGSTKATSKQFYKTFESFFQ